MYEIREAFTQLIELLNRRFGEALILPIREAGGE